MNADLKNVANRHFLREEETLLDALLEVFCPQHVASLQTETNINAS